MNQFNENYKDTGSKPFEEIERDAFIVSVLSTNFNNGRKEHLPQIAFVVSKSRGRGVLNTVRKQCSDGNDIQNAFITAKENYELLNHSMNSWSKKVQASKKRVEDLAYLNSLLDSCFKGWH